jgi:nucleoside-diphosphate-sugar epimerase
MTNHVVLGAGPVGRAIVQSLVSRQIDVTVVSRSGTEIPGARSIAASVLDTNRLKEIVSGSDVVYQAAQPEYHRWPEEFPAMQDSIVRAVRDSETVLVAVENLYGYGSVKGPISQSLPLVATGRKGKVRSDMWRSLETESKAGRLKVTAGRSSDFFGPFAEGSAVGDRFFLPLIAGKKAEVMGNPDALHSYTYVKDFGEALVRLALDKRSLGRAWHVPNAPALSNKKFLEMAAEIAGVKPQSKNLSLAMMKIAGLFVPAARELPEMLYEFKEDFVVDHSDYASTFGDHATPLNKSLSETIEWWRRHRP